MNVISGGKNRMLSLDKYTKVKYSIPFVAAVTFNIVKESKILPYDELKQSVIQQLGDKVSDILPLANALLFLLGKIEYIPGLDSIKALN